MLLACALLAVQIARIPPASGQSVLLDSPGVWTLRDLGYPGTVAPAGGETTLYTDPAAPPHRVYGPIKYVLPGGSAQGPDIWYIIHFHFEIEFEEDTQDGTAEVSAMLNFSTSAPFGTAALIEFNPVMRDGALVVDWNSLGLTDGWQKGTAESRRAEIWFSNYLPNDGVVPGQNSLLFAVKEYEGARVAALHVFDDTSIEVTPLSPPQLSVDVTEGWDPPAKGGDTFEVPYTVTNLGGWPAKEVVTEASYPEELLRLLGDRSVTTPLLDGREGVSGTFKFQALSPGEYDITLKVRGGTGGAYETTVTATITSREDVSKVRFWALVALVLTCSALPLIPFGRLLDDFIGRGLRKRD
jgi:hypothetical protein